MTLRIGIIVGSTRPGRVCRQVADWVWEMATARGDAEYHIVDLVDFRLPHLDEERPARHGVYEHAHTRRWSAEVDSYDGFVIVAPEYNHSIPGVLKDAFDFLSAEWHDKAVGFVSYGSLGGTRAVEHLRLIAGEFQMADVRHQVALSIFAEFEDMRIFRPGDRSTTDLQITLDQLIAWSGALAPLRSNRSD